MKTHRVRILLI